MSRLAILPFPDAWHQCQFLTCSVLPVRRACNCSCPFCFSKSSVSALDKERDLLRHMEVETFYEYSKKRGAKRLVITGGGEPLLRPERTLDLLRRAQPFFAERTLFTNGALLSPSLARSLQAEGLSYICWSRHAVKDQDNCALMGSQAPNAESFIDACGALPIRATCVMNTKGVRDTESATEYVQFFKQLGIREFTFKHTYVAYERSYFGNSQENAWAKRHQVQEDPFEGQGEPVAQLPWGPIIKRHLGVQLCHYTEPSPDWEKQNQLARSTNLLSDGRVFASLEDQQSLLFQLRS